MFLSFSYLLGFTPDIFLLSNDRATGVYSIEATVSCTASKVVVAGSRWIFLYFILIGLETVNEERERKKERWIVAVVASPPLLFRQTGNIADVIAQVISFSISLVSLFFVSSKLSCRVAVLHRPMRRSCDRLLLLLSLNNIKGARFDS